MSNRFRQISEEELNKRYYEWLCNLICVKKKDKTYWLLANALHSKEFEWFVPNDDNRAFEGINLRETFCDNHEYEYVVEYFPDGATMLEVIIGLAYRCQSIMEDTIDDMDIKDWFWKILSNVNLDMYTDDEFYNLNGQVKVNEILDRIINRAYQSNGRGGLFPIKRAKKDQRKVELWYQLNTYLVENYYENC